MRRFELVEGTSSKFWQIVRDSASILVQFGRIGTNGQAQQKSFDSDVAAEAEVTKLIREKVKKGYAEVGAPAAAPVVTNVRVKPKAEPSASPSETTATEQPATPMAPTEAPTTNPTLPSGFAWTDEILAAVAPSRRSNRASLQGPQDVNILYQQLRHAVPTVAALREGATRESSYEDQHRARLVADLQSGGVILELIERASTAFSQTSAPDQLDVEEQAVAFWLGLQSDTFVPYWVAKEGALFALRALSRARAIKPGTTLSNAYGWQALRRLLVSLDDGAYEALLSEAEQIQQRAKADPRVMLAIAFEKPEWCDKLVEQINPNAKAPPWLYPFMLAMPSFEEARRLFGRAQSEHTELVSYRYDLLARFGDEALPLFVEGYERNEYHRSSFAEGLSFRISRDVANFFIKHHAETGYGKNELRELAFNYLKTHRDVSIPALAVAMSTSTGKSRDVAKALLRTVAPTGADVESALPTLPGAAQTALKELTQQAGGKSTEAQAADLPSFLLSPPWLSKVKAAAPIVLNLTMLPFEDKMAWKAGEPKSKHYRLDDSDSLELADSAANLQATRELIRKCNATPPAPDTPSWEIQGAAVLFALPKEDLLDVAATLNVHHFKWYRYEAQDLIARHGVELIALILKTAAIDPISASEALVRANAARVAPLMAEAFCRLKKAKALATEWLLSFPEAAAVGLIPDAVGKPGKQRLFAETALRFVASKGHRRTIESVAAKYAASDEVRAVLDFDPLLTFPAKLPKMPDFWKAAAFSRPTLKSTDGKLPQVLPIAAVEAIGTMLAFTSTTDAYAGIAIVKELCDPQSLAEFAWDLFQAWLVESANSKEQWALFALAHFGDDETARRLTPLIRAWPGEAAHARAVMGLDVLALIGTDVALMHLHGIAQKLKFKGLQEKAREKIDQIAEARGLTAAELADRLVPDLGLDDKGSLELDFGTRKFRVAFDEALKPQVLDETGKRLPDLPKVKQTDHAETAKEATETWKALKKDAKTIASGQILRLELAMCSMRRWIPDVLRKFFIEHPLMIHLVRRLVWATYDEHNKVTNTFRVAEDGTLANAKDDTFALTSDAHIGIAHRLELDDATCGSWGQIFSDYEIIQPFAQLSRDIYVPTDAEQTGKKLDRWVDLTIPTGKVLGLDPRGWQRGPAQDAGVVCWYEKPLTGGRTAFLDLEPGIFTGMIDESPEQKLGSLTISCLGDPHWNTQAHEEFGVLSSIELSELIRDLESLR